MKRALVAALATLLCVLGLSCSKAKDDAEIVIVVDTDFAVPQQLNEVSFYVKRVGADESLAQTLTVPLAGRLGKPLPLRLGIAPDSDLDAAVEVRVEGYLIADPEAPRPAPVVRRKARLRFQRGKVLLLRMDLVLVCAYPKYAQCEQAASTGTCDESGCSDVEKPSIHPWTGSDGAYSPWDAGSPDDRSDSGTQSPDGGSPAEHDGGMPEPTPDAGADGGPSEDSEFAVELALADYHSCVRTSRGNVWCWGANDFGQLGDGKASHGQSCIRGDDSVAMPFDCSPTPVQAVDLPPTTQLSSGAYPTCALHEPRPVSDANLSCWGEVPQGNAINKPQGITYMSKLLDDVTEVRVGGRHACVRRQNHLPVCWGEYVSGELGNGDSEHYPDGDITEASKLSGLVTPADIAALALGDRHSCVRLTSGDVMCWGRNDQGQAGVPLTSELVLTPQKVEGASSAQSLVAGGARSCEIVPGEGAYCWGQGAFGELGIGDTSTLTDCPGFSRCTPAPVRVVDDDLGASIVELAVGFEFVCGRLSDGRVACWGRNTHGQIGPKAVEGEVHLPLEALKQKTLQVATGGEHACAILEDHSVVCWGRNDTGQLGVASGDSATAVRVPLPF